MEYIIGVISFLGYPFLIGWLNSNQVDPDKNPKYYKRDE